MTENQTSNTSSSVPSSAASPLQLPKLKFSHEILISIVIVLVFTYVGYLLTRNEIADLEYSRGMITVIFAFGTISMALILTIGSLMMSGPDIEQRLKSGREILATFIAIFGTVVGFYFASATQPSRPLAPVIASSEPASITKNTETLTLLGSGFSEDSEAIIADQVFKTIYNSPTKLSVKIKEIKLPAESTTIRIFNPKSGSVSNSISVKTSAN